MEAALEAIYKQRLIILHQIARDGGWPPANFQTDAQNPSRRSGLGSLNEGQRVSFETQRNPKNGKTSAANLAAA